MRISTLILAGSALALGGCAYGGLGVGLGYGSGYGGYGYDSPYYGGYYGSSYGYGSPYYGGYYGSSYGYGSPYYGWYDNYYYPGTGYYVYDSYRRPRLMTSSQRTYWTSRSPALRTTNTTATTTRTTVRPNWTAFNNRQQARTERQVQRQSARDERRANKPR